MKNGLGKRIKNKKYKKNGKIICFFIFFILSLCIKNYNYVLQ